MERKWGTVLELLGGMRLEFNDIKSILSVVSSSAVSAIQPTATQTTATFNAGSSTTGSNDLVSSCSLLFRLLLAEL